MNNKTNVLFLLLEDQNHIIPMFLNTLHKPCFVKTPKTHYHAKTGVVETKPTTGFSLN
jgi:hypothetical protein